MTYIHDMVNGREYLDEVLGCPRHNAVSSDPVPHPIVDGPRTGLQLLLVETTLDSSPTSEFRSQPDLSVLYDAADK